MEKLSTAKRFNIAKDYLSGLSYDEIATKNGVSKGSVANVIAELKTGKFPEAADLGEQIDLLRELSLELKRSNLAPGQCATGLTILNRINECGLDPADIDRWPFILKSIEGEDNVQRFVNMVYLIQDVVVGTGLSLEDLHDKVLEMERRVAELEPLSRQYEDYLNQVAALTKKRDNLAGEVALLDQRYNLLNPRVKELEKREQNLVRRIKSVETKVEKGEATLTALGKERQWLLEIGFSAEALAEFNDRVQTVARNHHVTPSALRERLLKELENLNQTMDSETLIRNRQIELEKLEQNIDRAKRESSSLKLEIGSLKQEKESLEAGIKEIEGKIRTEIDGIGVAARDKVNTIILELRHGQTEALSEVYRLRDEAINVGKEIGRYQEIVEENRWLSDLPAMIQGNEGIEGKKVRVISLLVLRGSASWLRQNKTNDPAILMLSSTTENLIKSWEQWKV